jgi:hypothetical protein
MSFLKSTGTFLVDSLTFPISYLTKFGSGGRTIGDMVTGTQRPPSTNGFMGNTASLLLDFVTFPVSTLTKAFTGNSIGDYVTGNTNEKRQMAEDASLSQENQMVNQRIAAQEGMSRGRSQSISTQNIGAAQAAGRSR